MTENAYPMRRMLIIVPFVAAAACSGGNGGGGSAEVRPGDVGTKLGCSVTTASTEELGVRELGKCSFDGSEVSIYTFASNDARDTYVEVAKQFGSRYLVLDRAVVTSDSSTAVDAAKVKVGGEIR